SDVGVLSVLPNDDGSVLLGTAKGLDRWNNARIAAYDERPGKLNGSLYGSLFRDSRGRIWISTLAAFGYLEDSRFISVSGIPGGVVRGIVEDTNGNLWIANMNAGLFRLSPVGEVQQTPWTKLRHKDFATALAAEPLQGGLWLGFYEGGVAYFAEGQVR